VPGAAAAQRHARQIRAGAGVVGSLLVLGVVDNLTGIELSLYPVYFLPLALAGTWLPRGYAVGAAFLATYVWGLSNFFAGLEMTTQWVWVFNVTSHIISFVVFVLLIHRLRAQAEAQGLLARTDLLTQLPNARGFYEHAAVEIDRQKRLGGALAAAYLDLDDFKKTNELLGHQGADELLATIGGAMRDATRRLDTVARLGGDEFAVLLPHTGEDEVAIVLDRLRSRVGAAVASGYDLVVTFSMGAVVFNQPPASVEELLRSTDALMYEVKRKGKNAVEIRVLGST